VNAEKSSADGTKMRAMIADGGVCITRPQTGSLHFPDTVFFR
jgi:hypothetical protein